jgi:hypothetical protein
MAGDEGLPDGMARDQAHSHLGFTTSLILIHKIGTTRQ